MGRLGQDREKEKRIRLMRPVYDPEFLGLQVARYLKGGAEALVFCPFHNDSNPSAEYNLRKGVFYCFGCQESRTANQLAEELGGSLIKMGAVPEDFSDLEGADLDWLNILRNPLALDNAYLDDRKVYTSQILEYEIKQNKDGVIFPLKNLHGQKVGAQIRRYKEKPKYLFYGQRTPVWPMEVILNPTRIFVTEGIFGALRGQASWATEVVAMMGAGTVKNTAKFLRSLGTAIRPYAIMDNDYAGLLAAGKFTLMEIPVILAPWRGAPDEWTRGQWDEVSDNYKDYATWEVEDIIGESEEPGKLARTLKKFWRKL